MSIQVMTDVWKHSRASGTPLLVLLCLADWADDEGECWPSVSSIARKCRLKDERHVKRVVHDELEKKLGEVVVILEGGKSSSKGGRRSNRYRITVHMPVDNDDLIVAERPPSDEESDADGGSQTTQMVVDRPPLIVVERPPEPSLDTSMNRERGRKRTTTLPAGFAITEENRAWACENTPNVDVDDETAKFIDHHTAKGTRYVDWVAGWQKWMRHARPTAVNWRSQPPESPAVDPQADRERLVTAIGDKFAHLPDYARELIDVSPFSPEQRERALAHLRELGELPTPTASTPRAAARCWGWSAGGVSPDPRPGPHQ